MTKPFKMHTLNFINYIIFALRAASVVVRFALSLFIAKEYGTEALGNFSLVAGVAAFAPATLGFGLNGTAYRELVSSTRGRAITIVTSKTVLTLIVYLFLLFPLSFSIMYYGIELKYLLYFTIILTDHVLADSYGTFISRNKIILANVFLSLRTGAWPLFFMVWFYVAGNMNFGVIFWVWLGFNAASVAWLLLEFFKNDYYQHTQIDSRWLKDSLKTSYLFYAYDVGSMGYQYADRFIVSAVLGLSATGVYSLLSSIIISTVAVIYSSIIQPKIPFLIEKHNNRNFDSLLVSIRRLEKKVVLYSLLVATCLLTASLFVYGFWGGETNLNGFEIFLIMLISVVLRSLSELYHLILYCVRQDIWMSFSAFIGMILALILILFSSYFFGIVGAGFSFLISSGLLLAIRWALVRAILY